MPPKKNKGKKKLVSGNNVTDAVGQGLVNKLNLQGANLGEDQNASEETPR
jgi:hypothetical protein